MILHAFLSVFVAILDVFFVTCPFLINLLINFVFKDFIYLFLERG